MNIDVLGVYGMYATILIIAVAGTVYFKIQDRKHKKQESVHADS